ncbi:hypothetical protein ACFLWA_00620 [Chloroflexota bacterium]
MSHTGVSLGYFVSLPERTLRAAAAGLGGLLYEATQVLLPGWLRRTRLYQAIIAGMLRIAIELVGGATNILPPDDVGAQELALRKAAGTGIELAGLVAIGLSPLWLFAATADLTGGTRTYLRALVAELRRDGFLPEDTDITSVEELLDTLEGTSGLVAESLDVPPLNVSDMRASWQGLRKQATDLPDADRLAALHADLSQVAQQEKRSLRSVSSVIAAGALRAGVKMGQVHIFDYYQNALRTIAGEGLEAYGRRVTAPYFAVAYGHFRPERTTYTERLLQRLLRRAESPGGAGENGG